MNWKRIDPALVFFGLGAFFCLVVSIPATSAAMDIFHGAVWGTVATAVFELGAVGLELMSLAIPQWRRRLLAAMVGMLLITTAFNYATGIDSYVAARLASSSTYAQIRAAGYGWLLTCAASALFPGMLGGFLLGVTARARMLRTAAHARDSLVEGLRSDLMMRDEEIERVSSICAELRETLAHRETELLTVRSAPAQLTDSQVTIGGRSYSVRKVARLLDMSESTLRSKLARIESEA